MRVVYFNDYVVVAAQRVFTLGDEVADSSGIYVVGPHVDGQPDVMKGTGMMSPASPLSHDEIRTEHLPVDGIGNKSGDESLWA